jgi:hypothetical protein
LTYALINNNTKELQGILMSLNRILSGSSDRNIGTRSIKTQIKPNLGSLKVASVLIASIALVACSGSSTTTAPVASTGAVTSIVGTWARCNVTGNTSNKVVTSFGAISSGPIAGGFSGQQSSQKTDFTDAACGTNGTLDTSIGIGSSLYQLGSAVTVDGTVAGITAATQFTGQTIPSTGDFDIIAANDTRLFFGDTSGNNKATSLALQPTQIETAGYTKQLALTTAELVGIWKDCNADGGNSIEQIYTFTTSTAEIVETEFTGSTDCSGGGVVAETLNTTYVLGNIVTVNGSIIGITNSTQITFTDTTDASNQLFDLVAIEGVVDRQLIFGDTEGDTQGDPDGETEANRATQLFGQAFQKQ